MKALKITILLALVTTLFSCSSVRVATDYDESVDFNQYQSFAFYKPGIDKTEISDLDKKRILRAIEAKLIEKGMIKSEQPDMLISIFTKTQENVNIYQNNWGWGYGWGWHPWYWNSGFNTVSRTTEGTLYIDLIDAKKKELIWQGMGTGVLYQNRDAKIEQINEMVEEILEKYPPEKEKK
ncbi:DUF4136 domain-containing protein [Mesonia sp. K7]|uniref:DUF4136 domain-containing protein n=1 Tax=Mesonia sp. K7 TaxID=2218606 RepID=UPI000DAA8854|nr:DUF4136 domain-containing protein [Mesonia sp. K7]PZD78666.1 DUF4136 domain-containing protein [Mesonia sp. K7]